MRSKRLQVETNMPMRIVELFVKQYGLVKFGFTNDLEGMWMKETYCIKFLFCWCIVWCPDIHRDIQQWNMWF